MKSSSILTAAFFALACHVSAQTNLEQKADKIVNWSKTQADKISRGRFDSTYVAVPKNKWMVFASVNGSYNKLNMDVPNPRIVGLPEEERSRGVYTHSKFRLHQGTQGMSVGLGYGSIRAKYSFSLSNHMASELHVEALGSQFGGFIDYRHSKKMRGTQFDSFWANAYYNDYDDKQKLVDDYTTNITSDRNDFATLHLQAHYVFNFRHFSYSAARTATRIQKKSAGSPIALIDFYQSTSKFEETLYAGYNERFKTWKAAVGGGYAYSYTPNGGKVLLHASVIPTVTLFGNSTYQSHAATFEQYVKDAYFKGTGEYPYKSLDEFKQKDPTGYEKAKKDYDEYLPLFDKYISGFEAKTNRLAEARTKITLNCTARVSVTWNIDEHYFLGAYGSYQYSNYANKYDYTIKEHNTSGQVFVGYRF